MAFRDRWCVYRGFCSNMKQRDFKIFSIFQDICKSLWCYRGKKRCETKFLPAAEGTSCGNGMVGRHRFTMSTEVMK